MKSYLLVYVALAAFVLFAHSEVAPPYSLYCEMYNKIYTNASELEMREEIYNSRVANFSLITEY